ncbi:hypothetical protein BRADI_1g00366v3 [Brachypodium distachyon]|uniref:Uncharacterized protein n=1 Tax=Brachypodium distachyon TaxID=15368 RepID=A0A0Q3GL61_BRADI|nr:hypothetical protein BRADI_1g00366v3 [Brachypodium distachyon]
MVPVLMELFSTCSDLPNTITKPLAYNCGKIDKNNLKRGKISQNNLRRKRFQGTNPFVPHHPPGRCILLCRAPDEGFAHCQRGIAFHVAARAAPWSGAWHCGVPRPGLGRCTLVTISLGRSFHCFSSACEAAW